MLDPFLDPPVSLEQLYRLTIELFNDEERITRALDWVDQALPVFAGACREEVRSIASRHSAAPGKTHGDAQEGSDAIAAWLAWLDSPGGEVIDEAGKGDVYEWRVTWLKTLLTVTRRLGSDGEWHNPPYRAALARQLGAEHSRAPACFPLAYWTDLVDYLSSALPEHGSDDAALHAVSFPLVLSDPVVDAGVETNVILAQFLLEPVTPATGEVFLHPEQTVMRCLDENFASGFRHGALAARHGLDIAQDTLPGVRVKLQTVKPSHERFLTGIMLRGESGGGALAIGLRQIYTAHTRDIHNLAISFALHSAGNPTVDGRCHPVDGADEKVRGCAKHGITHLLVAKQQQSALAFYASKQGVHILGASTVAEAASVASAAARPAVSRFPRRGPSDTRSAPHLPGEAASHITSPKRIAILRDHGSDQDAHVVALIEERLGARGHHVFVDKHADVGVAWAQETDRRIREADVVIPLLTAASVVSDLLAGELLTCDEVRQRTGAKPVILPVRVGYNGPLPERIAYLLDPLIHAVWRDSRDDTSLIDQIEQTLGRSPSSRASHVSEGRGIEYRPTPPPGEPPSSDLEPFDGLVPLTSRFYVERDADQPFLKAVGQRHSVILVKGARQMGKSSLLARGLADAERRGARTALTDYQKLSMDDLQSIRTFYTALARMLARQLRIDTDLETTWVERRSPNLNFEEYLEDYVLPATGPLVWAMDEVDKLFFSTSFSSDVFGLFRSWANERQGRAASPWSALTMVIAYATEAHLFIKDVNQSPFNVGTRFEMRDFTIDQVADLNNRYGSPLASQADLRTFYRLVGGHPYLVRRGLYAIVTEGIAIDTFETVAAGDNGPLGDHLRRILTLLARNADNLAAMREILRGKACPDFETFYHLRSAGVIVGDTVGNASIRCQLYQSYLERHLL